MISVTCDPPFSVFPRTTPIDLSPLRFGRFTNKREGRVGPRYRGRELSKCRRRTGGASQHLTLVIQNSTRRQRHIH